MDEATTAITGLQAAQARDVLTTVCAMADRIAVIDQSLRPLRILLEALSAPRPNGVEPGLLLAESPQRSDMDLRWIAILAGEGLIEVDPHGTLRLLDEGARRIAAAL